MVDYNQITIIGGESNKKVALTSEEQTIKNTDEKKWTDESATRKEFITSNALDVVNLDI